MITCNVRICICIQIQPDSKILFFKQIVSEFPISFRIHVYNFVSSQCNVCTQNSKLRNSRVNMFFIWTEIECKNLRVPYIRSVNLLNPNFLSKLKYTKDFLWFPHTFLLLIHTGKVFRKCGICKDIPVKFYHPVICIFGTLYDYNKSGIQIRDGHEMVSFGNWYTSR